MKTINHILISFPAVMLLSCAGFFKPFQDAVPPGTVITLHQDIQIPENRYSVRMQSGKILPYSEINQYYPNCEIVVRPAGKNFRLIKPGQFMVTRVNYEEMVQNNLVINVSHHGGVADATFEPYTTVLYLYSANQPQVSKLECSHWELITEAEHLTRKQIQTALGNIFTLEDKKNLP